MLKEYMLKVYTRIGHHATVKITRLVRLHAINVGIFDTNIRHYYKMDSENLNVLFQTWPLYLALTCPYVCWKMRNEKVSIYNLTTILSINLSLKAIPLKNYNFLIGKMF